MSVGDDDSGSKSAAAAGRNGQREPADGGGKATQIGGD